MKKERFVYGTGKNEAVGCYAEVAMGEGGDEAAEAQRHS